MSNIDDKIAELERQIELLKSLKKAPEEVLPINPPLPPYEDPLKPYRELMPAIPPVIPIYPTYPMPYYPPFWGGHPFGCLCWQCRPGIIYCQTTHNGTDIRS